MRILVFCRTRDYMIKYDMDGWLVLANVFTAAQRQETVQKFRDDPNARMVSDRSGAQGWRAPADTFILFDASWDCPMSHPISVQALMRRGFDGDIL